MAMCSARRHLNGSYMPSHQDQKDQGDVEAEKETKQEETGPEVQIEKKKIGEKGCAPMVYYRPCS